MFLSQQVVIFWEVVETRRWDGVGGRESLRLVCLCRLSSESLPLYFQATRRCAAWSAPRSGSHDILPHYRLGLSGTNEHRLKSLKP